MTTISPGQTLENPVTGERFTFTDTAGSTGGELLAFELALRPGGAVPIPHVHPIQTERFEVVAGRMRFRLGLRRRMAGPGDVVEVAPGVVHGFANAGDDGLQADAEAHAARGDLEALGLDRVDVGDGHRAAGTQGEVEREQLAAGAGGGVGEREPLAGHRVLDGVAGLDHAMEYIAAG